MKQLYPIFFTSILLLFVYQSSVAQCQASSAQVPTTATSVPFAGSVYPFSNPGSIFSGDGQFASASSLLSLLSGKTEYLQARGFGFAIPSNSLVCGIEAKITRSAEGINILSIVQDYRVQLMKNGSMIGDNLAKTDFWGLLPEAKPYGGAGNTWNAPWTADDVNSPNFGISVSAQMAGLLSLLPTAKISKVEVTVYYTLLLPVQIENFSLTQGRNTANLDWKLGDVESNTRYIIERSGDGVNWSPVYNYLYTGPQLSVQHMSYSDQSPLDGDAYYRLKIVQAGGSIVLSKVLRYSNAAKNSQLAVYPNPANDRITVEGSALNILSLYNANGILVRQLNAGQGNRAGIDISTLPKGLYVVKSAGDQMRFVKQ